MLETRGEGRRMGRREFHEGDEEEGGTDVCKGTEPGSAWVLPPT